MSKEDSKLDDVLDGFDEDKRTTLTRLITGTSFVAPVVVSFAMQGLSTSTVGAGPLVANGSGHIISDTSDVRLKTGLVRIGSHPEGFGIYRFRYLGSDIEYVGVIAQEVAEKLPQAVSASPRGILSVDYGAIGMEMTRLNP